MKEQDYEDLELMKKRAFEEGDLCLAAMLHAAARSVKRNINEDWTKDILKSIEKH